MRPWVSIDFETRSVIDLTKAGAHVYAEHRSTAILCMAWKTAEGQGLWWPGDTFPGPVRRVIEAGGLVQAWNAAFERLMWPLMVRRYHAPEIHLDQWRCTMVRALLQGFPGRLQDAGPSMGLSQVKDGPGHQLMLRVSKPRDVAYRTLKGPGALKWKEYGAGALACEADPLPEYTRTTDAHGVECRVRWWVDEERLTRLGRYCLTDVAVEHAAAEFLDPMPGYEILGWQLDQRINDRGVQLDRHLIQQARELIKPGQSEANASLCQLTDGVLDSINKPNDIRAWLNRRLDLSLDSIEAKTLRVLKHDVELDDVAMGVVDLRLTAAKNSTAKLNAMLAGVGSDDILRGGLQYAGAGRTSRWAGRRVQPHNFPRPPKWAPLAADVLAEGGTSHSHLRLLFGPLLEIVSAVLRSCLVARPGRELVVADYNAIEARIVAWLADATKLLDAFRTGKDPYRMLAAVVFGIADWRTIPVDSLERLLGKKGVLGLGFGMGEDRFHESCREDELFIPRALSGQTVQVYRADNSEIPDAWRVLERTAMASVDHPNQWHACLQGRIHFCTNQRYTYMRLPSGRMLFYLAPRLVHATTPWGKPCRKFQFWGWNSTKHRMEWQTMFGGRWMENAAQGIARDILLAAMLRLDADGWHTVLTVHDELLNDEPLNTRSVGDLIDAMETPLEWALDLPLKAEGWKGPRYRK